MNLSRSRRRRKQRDGDLSESASLSPTNSVGMDQLETVDYTVHTNDLFLSDINPTNIYLDQNIQEWLTTLLQSTPKANAAILKVMRKDDIQTVRDLGRYSDTWLLDNANQEIIQPIYRIKFNAIVKHIHLLLEEEVPQAHVEESQGSDYDPNGGEISLAKSFGKSSSDSDETESEEDADQADENEGEGDNEEDDTRNSNGRKTSMTSSQSVMVHFARHAGSHSPIPQLLNVPEDDDDDDAEQQHHEPEDNDEEEEEKEEEEEEEDQLEAFPPSPIPSPTSKESVPAPKSPPWTAPPPPLPVPPTFDLNSSTKKSKKRARKDETVHQQFQRTTSEAAANSKNQKFKRTASEAAKLRRSQANNKSSSSSSSSTTTPLKKKQKIEFDLQVGDFCDYYIRGYGWYTAKINRMISSDQVELINFDSHPDDRSTYKIKLNKLTKSGRKLWAPFGEETCETPYVHDTDLSLQKQLQSLIRTMKAQRFHRNTNNGDYLWNMYFRRSVTHLWPSYSTDYNAFISEPMDFHKLENNLKNHEYDIVHTFFDDLSLIWRNAIQYSLKITTQIPGQGLGRPDFFPIQSALSLRFWVANVAREHFGLNLRSKFPLPDRVVDENFYPGVN